AASCRSRRCERALQPIWSSTSGVKPWRNTSPSLSAARKSAASISTARHRHWCSEGRVLGKLITSLDDPQVVVKLMAAVGDPDLLARLMGAAEASGRSPAEIVASAVRQFADTASDDLWTQLIGLMNRAEDPGIAALKAILVKCLPENGKTEMHL